jgi:hypothetical protein
MSAPSLASAIDELSPFLSMIELLEDRFWKLSMELFFAELPETY